MFDKKELVEKLNELSPRELDVLVGRHVYGKEIKIERIDSKNKNNIKYLWVPDKKRKYTRNFSKSITKTERKDSKFRPLPRWSSDIRDCYMLLNAVVEEFEEFQIKILDRNRADVVVSSMKFSGTLCVSIVRMILFITFLKEENEKSN